MEERGREGGGGVVREREGEGRENIWKELILRCRGSLFPLYFLFCSSPGSHSCCKTYRDHGQSLIWV